MSFVEIFRTGKARLNTSGMVIARDSSAEGGGGGGTSAMNSIMF